MKSFLSPNVSSDYYVSKYSTLEEIILSIILILIMVFAFYGNLCMIIVLYKNNRMWNSTYMLIGNLAMCGLLVTIFCMPFNLISVMYGYWPFKENAVCKFNAFMVSQLLLATIFTHTIISVDKYFNVVKPFSRTMTVKRTRILIFSIWFIAVVMTIVPLFGLGRFAYNPTTLICGVGFPRNKLESVYLLTLALIAFVIPNFTMMYTYTNVFLAVRKHSKRLHKTSSCSFNVMTLQKRLIKTVFLSFLCFVFCWSPFFMLASLSLVLDSPDELPHALGVASYWCGYMYNALNPIIISIMNARFGEGLTNITYKIIELPFLVKQHLTRFRNDISGRGSMQVANAKYPSDEPLNLVTYGVYSKVGNGASPVIPLKTEN